MCVKVGAALELLVGMGLAPTGGSGPAARRCPTARSSLLVMLKSKSSSQPARQEKKVPNLH